MNELTNQGGGGFIRIRNRDGKPAVSGRELHVWLGVGTAYKDWFPRMCEYGFAAGTDYTEVSLKNERNPLGGRPAIDHELTIPMGKELSMLQRTERGKQARRYFIALEDAWNTPEAVMARALQMANAHLDAVTGQLQHLRVEHTAITVQNQIMAPKADYFDELVNRNLLTNFRETAMELGVGQKAFIRFLTDRNFLYRDKKDKLLPYADKNDGLFEVKECFNDKTNWAGVQTLVTPKGRETFRLLLQSRP